MIYYILSSEVALLIHCTLFCSVNGGCSDSTNKRGKVPNRPEYSISENGITRKLARIIPHGPDACIDSTAASAYLNQADVMTAIHVNDPGYCWSVCATQPGWSYDSTRTNLPKNTYPLLVSAIEVLIYNGGRYCITSYV